MFVRLGVCLCLQHRLQQCILSPCGCLRVICVFLVAAELPCMCEGVSCVPAANRRPTLFVSGDCVHCSATCACVCEYACVLHVRVLVSVSVCQCVPLCSANFGGQFGCSKKPSVVWWCSQAPHPLVGCGGCVGATGNECQSVRWPPVSGSAIQRLD